jgi:Holliday junction resolvase RusA-like endonuclease
VIRIDVLGMPAPKGNARAFVNKKTGRAVLASFGSGDREKRLRSWDSSVRIAARDVVAEIKQRMGADDGVAHGPAFIGVPLAVVIVFRMARPTGHWHKKTGALLEKAPAVPATKPDVDKLARSTLDPLHDIVFDDDSRVVELMVRKEYAKPGYEGATIMVDAWRPA